MCVCVSCLFASISGATCPIFAPNFLRVLPMAVARSFSGGVAICYFLPVLWMTSCSHIGNGSYGNVSIPLQRVASLRRRAQANVHAALYWLRRCPVRRRAPRLDESIVLGVPGAESAVHHCLVLQWTVVTLSYSIVVVVSV